MSFRPLRRVNNFFLSIPAAFYRFSLIDFLYWAAMPVGSFTTVYLQGLGYSALDIGSMNAAFATVNIIAPPLWGFLSDKVRSVKKIFALCMVASAIVWFFLPHMVVWFSIAMVWVMLPLYRLFSAPSNALVDSWIIQTVSRDRRLSYGSIRLWGSIGYAIVAIIYGALLKTMPIETIFWGFGLFAIPCAALALFTKEEASQSRRSVPLKEMQIGRIFKTVPLVAFLMFNICLYMPVNASFTFLPFLLESVGESSSFVGTIMGIKALMEIPLLLFSGKLLKRFKITNLIMICACMYTAEMILYTFCVNSAQILIVQCLHGVAFGLYLSCQVQYIHSLAPEGLTATAQTLSGCTTAIASIAGNLLGGVIINFLDVRMFYLFSGVLQALAVTVYFLWQRAQVGKTHARIGAAG